MRAHTSLLRPEPPHASGAHWRHVDRLARTDIQNLLALNLHPPPALFHQIDLGVLMGMPVGPRTRLKTDSKKSDVPMRQPFCLSSRDFHFARRIRAFITPTRLSARQISSSHVASLPVEAALDVEPTRAPAFRASLRHRSTPMLFLRQADFVALRPGVSRPAPVAPRSSAACRRTAAGSDALLPAGASSTAHASPGGLRFSPAAAEDS